MRIGRFILTLVLTAIACGTVMLWPHSPRWTQTVPGIHELVQFSQDSKSLIVAEGWCTNSVPTETASLAYFDLKSGKVTQRIPLTFPPGTFINKYWLTPDAQSIFAQVSTSREGYNVSTGGTSLVAYDVATGKQLCKPLPSTHMHFLEFSPDRRWFWYTMPETEVSDDELSKVKDYANRKNILRIASTADFRDVLSIAFNPSTQAFHCVGFLADHFRMAVLSTRWPGKSLLETAKNSPEKPQSLQQLLEVWDLQTGKKTHSSLMPDTHRWYAIEKAIGQDIFVRGNRKNPLKAWEDLGELSKVSWVSEHEVVTTVEPLVSSTIPSAANISPQLITHLSPRQRCMGFGDDWVCHAIVHDLSQSALSRFLQWMEAKVGMNLKQRRYPLQTICVIDRPSGKTRLEIPVKIGPHMLISDDGQHLAQTDYDNLTIELWDANPAWRWPYALAVGLLICIIMMLWGRKSKLRSEIASAPSG